MLNASKHKSHDSTIHKLYIEIITMLVTRGTNYDYINKYLFIKYIFLFQKI